MSKKCDVACAWHQTLLEPRALRTVVGVDFPPLFFAGADGRPVTATIGVEVLVIRGAAERDVGFGAGFDDPFLGRVLVAAVLRDDAGRLAVGRAREDHALE